MVWTAGHEHACAGICDCCAGCERSTRPGTYCRSLAGREVERLTTALPRGRALCRCSPAPPAPETELFDRRTGREPGLGPDGPGGRGTGERGERETQPEADEHARPEKRQYRARSSL